MKILITGANGFVGRNLVANLRAIQAGKNRTVPVQIDQIFTFDLDTPSAQLEVFCQQADFVFHLAGVNRPTDSADYMKGNFGFTSTLLSTLQKYHNTCPVMLASSIQASLQGRYADSEYGKSKLAGEELFFTYARQTGASVYVYRFANLFGKWCRPNYNSAVATFCYNIARGLPIQVNDRSTALELLYIDDLLTEMYAALQGKPHRCTYDSLEPVASQTGPYCYVPVTHHTTLGEVVDLLHSFAAQAQSLLVPNIPSGSLAQKLYATYVSYLPQEKVVVPLTPHTDERGSFTELLKTIGGGQFSVNISKPGITKGNHWHNSKWEFFIVVSGKARIEQRKLDTNEVWTFEVSGDAPQAVHMLPGYTHNIINVSQTENLITLMWASETFNPQQPDTFAEQVKA
ncbi:MAG: NAD-dependent epimerase/dehydratase family protein [Elusimicrobiaceae bacterium]|nr:NAD-dependent epimerase/dehydratase family protein [Elusimicrobiaceae bacterium]